MPVVFRKASLSLNILVVGGGIGGLAVAYVLSKSGHRVRVIEKHSLDKPSGGHRITPNVSKILRQWIGDDELSEVATRCTGNPFYRFDTGERAGYLGWEPAVLAETGGDFLLMHREDLVRILYRLATDAGARVDLNMKVTSVQQGTDDSPSPVVTLGSGEVLTVDLVVGADGCNSAVREVVLEDDSEDQPFAGGLVVYTGVVKAEDAAQQADLIPLFMAEEWPVWMGEHISFMGHPVRKGKEYYFSLFVWNDANQAGEESWDEPRPSEEVVMPNQCSVIQQLIRLSPHIISSPYMVCKDPKADWVDSTERIVLLGDAAHPMMPAGTNTTSMAVEDAVVLGSLLSHLSSPDQISTFLSAYVELRKKRCRMVVRSDTESAQTFALPPGPERDARDAAISRDLGDWDEGTFKGQFEQIADIFLYDAGDAAEEWWINWGRLHEAVRERRTRSVMEFSTECVSVSRS